MTVRLIRGDVRERLAELPDQSVQCVVTSPPYYGLRDYGTAQWDGGDPGCDHRKPSSAEGSTLQGGKKTTGHQQEGYGRECRKCGAVRVDRQIGLEPTLAAYVETMVQVFREVRRVLRNDGTLWLNVGDSYNAQPGQRKATDAAGPKQLTNNGAVGIGSRSDEGLKPKDLMMVPARVALALQDDGWWLRSDIIWHKPNPMPESVTDRPTSAHEHIFLLTKSARYYYDADAIREPLAPESAARYAYGFGGAKNVRLKATDKPTAVVGDRVATDGANARNVWTIATAPYKDAHFATFPPELPRRCIKAGTSEKGCCAACGAPWVRDVGHGDAIGRRDSGTGDRFVDLGMSSGRAGERHRTTTGWSASCTCDAPVVPCVVLDPFAGAGTTLLVADQLGRDAIGIELNPTYADLAKNRVVNDAPLFAEVRG